MEYFKELNEDINNAQTKLTLKYCTRRANRLKKNLSKNPPYGATRHQIMNEYRYSIKLISSMKKRLRT